MGHHLDSPLARRDVRLDITDLYVFRGETGTVLVLNLNSSTSGEEAPRGFHPEGRYEFKIDLDGDAVEDLTYRVVFDERDEAGRQDLELRRLSGFDAGDPTAPGMLVARGVTDTQVAGEGGLRLWAGQAAEPFYVDSTVLAAVRNAVRRGTRVDLSGWRPENAVNAYAGTTVHSIVLEVSDGDLRDLLRPGGRVGVWAATMRPTDPTGWQQVNRMGLPMIQLIFNPEDSERASDYNTTQPADDRANYGHLLAGLIAGVVGPQGTAEDPHAYGRAMAELLLPDVLPYRVGTPACYGFAERNGRALTDNAPEVMFSLVTNSALADGLAGRHASGVPGDRFPYLAVAAPAVAGADRSGSPGQGGR
jgi:hypothetical protein